MPPMPRRCVRAIFAALLIAITPAVAPVAQADEATNTGTSAALAIALSEIASDPASSVEGMILDVPTDDTARAVVRANQTAAISAEVNARIVHLPAREGDRFKKGDIIVEFDCRQFSAEHDAAHAAMKGYEAAYRSQLKLLEYKSTGTASVDQAYHQLERAKSELRGHAVRLEACRILAPFDGRMTEKIAQVHEIAQPNQPLIRIVNEDTLELVLMVPSVWLPRLSGNPTFTVQMDETGEALQARVLQTTGIIDPVSQSLRVIAQLVNPPHSVMPGMSGTATFPQQKAEK